MLNLNWRQTCLCVLSWRCRFYVLSSCFDAYRKIPLNIWPFSVAVLSEIFKVKVARIIYVQWYKCVNFSVHNADVNTSVFLHDGKSAWNLSLFEAWKGGKSMCSSNNMLILLWYVESWCRGRQICSLRFYELKIQPKCMCCVGTIAHGDPRTTSPAAVGLKALQSHRRWLLHVLT